MLFNPSILILGIAGLSSALPIFNRRAVTPRDAQPQAVQVVSEEIVIYVDLNGNPVSTSTNLGVPVPTTSSTSTSASATTTPPVVASTVAANVNVAAAPTTSEAPPATSSSSSSSGGSGGLGVGAKDGSPFSNGVTYSADGNSGSCKPDSQQAAELAYLIGQGHDLIRIYGVECNGPKNLQAAVSGKQVWMFLGIFDIASAASEASQIASQLGNNWNNVHTIAVGNEVVNSGGSVDAVVGAISAVKSALNGYTGPIITVDTAVAVEANPQICKSSDYCAVNCHAFWDGNDASDAKNTITYHVNAVKAATGMDKVVISETGWPTCGSNNGDAVPSKAAQGQALSSIKSVADVTGGIMYFSGFNELWKQNNANTFGAEQCWGIYNNIDGY